MPQLSNPCGRHLALICMSQGLNKPVKIYIAASFRHLHGVRLLAAELRRLNFEILDWTSKASPPPGLTAAQRRIWMDTDQNGGQVFEFCREACLNADLVIYFGESGQDAGVEIGLAHASNVPILGIRGPLESPGLMLHGAIDCWVEDTESALKILSDLALLASSPDAKCENPLSVKLNKLINER